MSRNRRNVSRPSRQNRLGKGCSKMHVRTERMHAGVRLGMCVLVLMGCVAFMVAALPDHRSLETLKTDLLEVHGAEMEVAERVDAKERELRAIETDPEYRELIARDRLNYYIPGEHVFRLEN